MVKLKDFGSAFARLNEEDKAAVVTTVMETPRIHGRDLSSFSAVSAVKRIASSDEGLELAREFYKQWQLAGKQSSYVSRAMKYSNQGRSLS